MILQINMTDVKKSHDADDDQINSDDVVEQLGRKKNDYTRNQCQH